MLIHYKHINKSYKRNIHRDVLKKESFSDGPLIYNKHCQEGRGTHNNIESNSLQ